MLLTRKRTVVLAATSLVLFALSGVSGTALAADGAQPRPLGDDSAIESESMVQTNETVSGTLNGTVTDEDGEPITTARLLTPGVFDVMTDENGEFERSLEPGEYEVTVKTSKSDAETSTMISIEANETTTIDFTLSDSGATETESDDGTETGNDNETETEDDGTENEDGDSVPGFDVTAGVTALLGSLLLSRRL